MITGATRTPTATPTATQMRLLPAPQPLVERLGAGFFRQVPRLPGVYRIHDRAGALVYVGKAKDLRARLSSYRRTHGQSRKTVALIHAAWRIEWEVCPSEVDARLLENELIRSLRPRFNRMGTWPRSARFLMIEAGVEGFRLTVTGEPAGECYGAFRGGVALAVGALARLLWLSWHRTADLRVLPLGWVGLEGLRSFAGTHPAASEWLAEVRAFFRAENDGLIARLVAAVPEAGTPFGQAYIARQFETLSEFYRRGPLRNRHLRERFAPGAQALAPEELDDLLVLAPPEPVAPLFRPPA